MTIMLAILAACCFGGAAFVLLEEVSRSRRELRRSFARVGTYGRVPAADDTEAVELSGDRPLRGLAGPAAAVALRLSPRTTLDGVQLRLATAGMTSRISAHEFLALKLAFGGGAAAFGFILGLGAGSVGFGLFLLLLFGTGGFLLPDWLLKVRVRSRQDAIRAALPNALDLLAVTVEAGLGLPAAMARLTEITKGPLADEFALALGQMSMGESRADALRRMADRLAVPELTSFVRAVVQADQLGAAMGRTLRLQASETRSRRQLAAEERAQKAPIKMLLPTALFIFPTLFIVALGPAAMSIMRMFG